MKASQNTIQKILVVTLSNLGDAILTLPVFESLGCVYPDAKLDVVVGEGAKAVFEGDDRIRNVISYNKKISWAQKWRFLQDVRRERYDLIVDLRHSLIGLLGGAKFHNRYFILGGKPKHRALRHATALNGIAPIRTDESFLRASISQLTDDLAACDKIAVAAVGSKSHIKKWPVEYYAALLDKLVLNDGCQIVLVGDKNDAADADKVKRLMVSPVLDFTGRTNFCTLCAIIGKAAIVITNDSAPLHIADALNIPTLAIFGPTDPEKYGPRHSSSQAVRRTIFCSPCERALCRYHHECMSELGVDEVYAKAIQILSGDRKASPVKILVIRLDRIGDVVLSLPAIEAVRAHFPEAHLAVMTRPATAPLLEGHPDIDEVIPYFYEKKGRHRSVIGNARFIYEIIRRKFDIVFILNPSLRSYLVPFCAGIPYRVGFKTWPLLLTHAAEDRRHEGAKHEAEYTLDVIRAFGIKPETDLEPQLPVTDDLSLKISESLDSFDGEVIAIHPGASCVSKRWPKEYFAELGKKIQASAPCRLAIIGGKEEAETGRYLAEQWGRDAIDLAGKLTLGELPAFLKRCELLISNDSGPAHVAAAVGTRTISIFGRNREGLSPKRWRPLGAGNEAVQKDVGCVVCLAHRCPIDFECLKAIKPEEVYEKVQKILQ